MNAVEFNDVCKSYKQAGSAEPALRGATFAIAEGEVAAVIGPSGSGKTTLLNLAAGMDRPTSGQVCVLGENISKLSRGGLVSMRRRKMGFVFQTLNLLPGMTVRENIELPLVLNGWTAALPRERIASLLETAGLGKLGRRLPGELSTGQQQRAAVLRAVAHRPAVVLMDEPTSSLDSEHAATLLRLVAELNAAEGTTVVISTHDPDVAAACRRILRLHDGWIVTEPGV